MMESETSMDSSPPNVLPPVIPSDHTRTYMDMKQQLVLWKKASYLMDNISLTQEFMEKLVDYGLFNREMMDQIYVSLMRE
jgi:hypothetical protein